MRILFLVFLSSFLFQCSTPQKKSPQQERADRTLIIRDKWGVAHVFGQSDADAVFGMIYAQCEDDFNRVEVNYINAMGRMAEVEGESALMKDLRMHLFIDTLQAAGLYDESPEWLRELLNAFADGANYYLETHPETKPKLITKFKPWMPLMFSEGSIGGDIETVSLEELSSFYDKSNLTHLDGEHFFGEKEPTGSNGFAIAPSKTTNGNALLMINPHTSFYFRPEIHMASEEGLNAYGAVTWGQFFIYQGFNQHCGWMHTSSRADAIDEYIESIKDVNGKLHYQYGDALRPVEEKIVTLAYKNGDTMETRQYVTYHTHHGPIIANRDGKWISIRMMNDPINALTQSFFRTKSSSLEEFKETMQLKTNSSNNTVYADDKGNIAYFHGNFLPRRDTLFDWNHPVDGSNPATEWKGLLPVEESVHIINPSSGWIQNCNSTPFTVSGEASPKEGDYPSYMAPDFENPRGIHAVRVLKDSTNFTLEKLILAAYDSYLPAFEQLIPHLLKAYDMSKPKNKELAEPVQELRNWDYRFGENSVATSLAIYWMQAMFKITEDMLPRSLPVSIMEYQQLMMTSTSDKQKLEALVAALDVLQMDFSTWKTGWGEINRFQRLTGDIIPVFDDTQPSYPVGFTSALWGSLASYGSRTYPGTKRWYGTSGNSFVAAVEFGEKVKAKSVLAGGVNGDPQSPFFNNQGEMYSKGEFKDVLFYRDEIEASAISTYHPGNQTVIEEQ